MSSLPQNNQSIPGSALLPLCPFFLLALCHFLCPFPARPLPPNPVACQVVGWKNVPIPEQRLRFWTEPEVEIGLAAETGIDILRLGIDWGRIVPREPPLESMGGSATLSVCLPAARALLSRRFLPPLSLRDESPVPHPRYTALPPEPCS